MSAPTLGYRQQVKLTVYGDFNCPYSALASCRVDELLRRGLAEVEWRAVEHEPELPDEGVQTDDERRKKLEDELVEIRGLRRPDEGFAPQIPEVYPNTRQASCVHSTYQDEAAHYYRREAFEAVWKRGRNISDPAVLGEAGVGQREPLSDGWQREWEDIERKAVPLIVSEDGSIARGTEALALLSDLLG